MNHDEPQTERKASGLAVVSVRVHSAVLNRVRALVRQTPEAHLAGAIEDALTLYLHAYPIVSEEVIGTDAPLGRAASTVLCVRVPDVLMHQVRAAVVDQPGMTIARCITRALQAWCSRHLLADYVLATPRDLRRGGDRQRTQRAPRDLFVIMEDDELVAADG